jgi:hypothetical protein
MGKNTSSIHREQDNSQDDNIQGSTKMQANLSTAKGDSDALVLLDVELHWLEAHWKT